MIKLPVFIVLKKKWVWSDGKNRVQKKEQEMVEGKNWFPKIRHW